jgi:DNA-binding NarL/FixJ family response regulator
LMTRVLVVDDHAAWRQQITAVLRDGARWQVVGEASDGVEAVQQARALQPDLILLDVGLPGYNGIQAAQHILEADPRARILFLSEHRSWDIAEAALCTGARGYIVKSDAASELLPALEAIARGRRFVGARLAGRGVDDADPAGWQRENRRHEAVFCADVSAVVEGYARWAAAALEAGDPVVIVSSDVRQEQLRQQLHARGIDAVRAIKEGKLRSLRVADTRQQFMRDGRIEEALVWNAATSLIMDAARASTREYPRVVVCGEIAPLLWMEGQAEAALRLEQIWDEIARTYNIDVFCPYCPDCPSDEQDIHVFQRIQAEHSAIHWGKCGLSGADDLRSGPPASDPLERGTRA